NARALELADRVACVVADGTAPPFRPGGFDRVLLDAPCSGLGALRRRPDARWRIDPDDVAVLASLQRRLLDGAAALVRPGGLLAYGVCPLGGPETCAGDDWPETAPPERVAPAPPDAPWQRSGRGALLLPQTAGTDGMFLLRLRRAEGDS